MNSGRFLVLIALVLTGCAGPGLNRYRPLVRHDPAGTRPNGVRITYLGVNGYLLESGDATVLVDPYFTRLPPGKFLASHELQPDPARINYGLGRLPRHRPIDLILVTHSHPDHLFDARPIAKETGARIVASTTGCNLLRAFDDDPPLRLTPMLAEVATSGQAPGKREETRRFGAVTVQALETEHDRLFGFELFPGTRKRPPARPPASARDWVCGQPLAFIVTMGGKRIYLNSGGRHAPRQEHLAPVDLAIIGVALPDSRKCFRQTVEALQPAYILPSHQDNFFAPPESPFRFGAFTNFGSVQRALRKRPDLSHKLILLDYFQPWTLQTPGSPLQENSRGRL